MDDQQAPPTVVDLTDPTTVAATDQVAPAPPSLAPERPAYELRLAGPLPPHALRLVPHLRALADKQQARAEKPATGAIRSMRALENRAARVREAEETADAARAVADAVMAAEKDRVDRLNAYYGLRR